MQAGREVGQRYVITMSKFQRRRLSMNTWKHDRVKTQKCMTPRILNRVIPYERPPDVVIEDDSEVICKILEKAKPPKTPQSHFQFFTEVDVKEQSLSRRRSRTTPKKTNCSVLFQEWREICNEIGLNTKLNKQPKKDLIRKDCNTFKSRADESDLDLTEAVIPRPVMRISVLRKSSRSTTISRMTTPMSGRRTTPFEDLFANEGIRYRTSRNSKTSWRCYTALPLPSKAL